MENSAHHAFWADARNILRNMRFVHKKTHKIVTSVPTLQNWFLTIHAFQKIWKKLNSTYGFLNCKTRYCNQDPIENFFGQIRSHAVRHTNPTPRQFEYSFITLLVNNMKSLSIIGSNCEIIKDDFMLFSLEECLKTDVANDEPLGIDRNDSICDEPHDLVTDKVVCENSITASLSEHMEDVITTILKKIKYCEQCDNSFKNSEFIVCARQIINMLTKLLKTRAHRRNILKTLLQYFDNWNIDLSWHRCTDHHNDIFKTMVRVIAVKVLTWWCTRKNILIDNEVENTLICELDCSKDIV
ncbi:PREDICTED: uncharacterized protein LOC105565911 [Vollenhovia emeryi]|uniref:uncharacterized protein LOC105565911 n=1 Tax=Vollenhovia emeryi TaxID=411798 RepID=UPI0005F4019C|nr:PREDICTED: uncharacterized protein LOC105565911 [Vollenhovia emeryi]